MSDRIGSAAGTPIRRLPPPVIAYWVFTLVVAFENLSGFVWVVAKLE